MERINIVLLRVFSDLVNIGYYSVLHEDDCYTLLPIVERHKLREIPAFLDPRKIRDRCSGDPLIKYYLFSKYDVVAIHNDPRIDLGFYTEEYRGGRLPRRKLGKGDLVLFMSGLARYPDKIWYYRSTRINDVLKELKRRGDVGIYLIGGIVVDKTLTISSSDWGEIVEKYQVLMYSPHYYRLDKRETYAIIGRGFYVKPPLRLANLTPRGYKLSKNLLTLIGRTEAYKLVKQNFRKTKYLGIDREKIESMIMPRAEFS